MGRFRSRFPVSPRGLPATRGPASGAAGPRTVTGATGPAAGKKAPSLPGPRAGRGLRSVPLLAAWVLFLLLAGVLAACVTNPATGRRQLLLVDRDREIRLGREALPGIRSEYGAYDDPALASWVKTIGGKLAAVTEDPSYPFSFTVLDSPVVNAFALPGGPVFVTRGLIAHANSEAELAGVLGHEIGHVEARHGAEQLSQQQLLAVGLGVAGMADPRLGRVRDLLGTAARLLLLSYSRRDEREADMLGVRYMARAGWDPLAFPAFLSVLDRLEQRSGQALPSWLSTHPAPADRVAVTRQLARKIRARKLARGKTLVRHREILLERVDGLVFGDDPRQGFLHDGLFRHPGLRFRVAFPPGWKLLNTNRFVAALDDPERPSARLVLELVPPGRANGLPPAEYVARLARRERFLDLDGSSTTVGGFPAWIGFATVPGREGTPPRPLLLAAIRDGEHLYRFVGAFAGRRDGDPVRAMERTVRSFARETDPAVLGVEPVRIHLVAVPGGRTLAEICATIPDLAVPCRDVALLNHVHRKDTVERGSRLKVPLRGCPIYP